jgi:alkanesulfonate monooxygenase SsuD/methylene tetrahydromethanopterin reductase-like flavin-dependent oxidoreductase (luciferase family)
MLAAAHTVAEMWEKRYYEEHSEFLEFPERMVTPKPYQDPHPPVWMAVTSEESANIAGSNGLGMLSFSPVQALSKTQGQIEEYRRAAQHPKPLTNVTTNKVAGYTLVHCADSMDDAVANGVWGAVDWWYRGLIEFIMKWEWTALMPEDEISKSFPMLSRPVEEYDNEDMIIVGDVDKCIRKMQKYADLGVDQLLCYVQFGQLPHEGVMRSIELLGKEVIPVIEAYEPKR